MYFKKSKTLLKFRDVSLKKGLMFFKQDVAKLFQITYCENAVLEFWTNQEGFTITDLITFIAQYIGFE